MIGPEQLYAVIGEENGLSATLAAGTPIPGPIGPEGPQGPPGDPATQTPWAQDIDAAVYDLNNVGVVRFASYTTPGPVNGIGNEAGTLHLLTDNGGSIDIESIGTGRIMVSTDATRRIVVRQNGNVGIGPSMNPSYLLDVQGDCNVEGVYRIDGVPIATGAAAQTPWLSNIDAAGFNLTNGGSGSFAGGVFCPHINNYGFQGNSVAPGNNELIRANSAGNVFTNWIHTIANDVGTAPITRVYASNDDYIRYYSLANFAAQIKPLAQTPWAQNVDAAGYWLSNVDKLTANNELLSGGYLQLLDPNHGIKAVPGVGVKIHTFGAADGICLQQSTGNVGIGTATPGYRLDVAGIINSSTGGFRFPDGTTQVTAGQKQTPWAQNVDAAGFSLTNAGQVTLHGTVPGASYNWSGLIIKETALADASSWPDPNYAPRITFSWGGVNAPQIGFDIPSQGIRTFTAAGTAYAPFAAAQIESKSGGFKFPDGTTQITAVYASGSSYGFGTGAPTMRVHVSGAGQYGSAGPLAIYNNAGPHDASVFVQASDVAAGSGGTVVFGSPFGSGSFAAIKGAVISGSDNSVGDLVFLTRNVGSWTYLQETMRLTYYGRLSISDSSWNLGHFVMGAYHLWVDAAGKLRIKSSAPASDTDGTIVGTQA